MDVTEIVNAARSSPSARGLVASAALFVLLWAFDRRERLLTRGRVVLALSAGTLAFLGLVLCAHRIATHFLVPRDWDFLCFWTYGRALALGHSPYDVSVLREIAAPQSPSAEFLNLNYCCYPPICLPLFWPFGYLPFQTALAAWYVVQVAALVMCVALLWRFWDAQKSWLGLVVTLAIVLSWHATTTTLFFAQSSFLLLLAILLVMLSYRPAWRGIWLGLAIVVKPIAAILVIDLFIRRQWRPVLVSLLPLSVAFGLFLVAQGWPGLMYYKDRNPIAGDVAYQFYVESVNESLLAVLLRLFESPPLARPVFFPPFVLLGGLLTAATIMALIRLPSSLASLGMGYVVTLALLVYPGTLTHYSVLLIVPAAVLWQQRTGLPGGPLAAALTIAIAYGLVWGRLSFAAHLVTWTAFTVLLTLAGVKRIAPPSAYSLAKPIA